MALSRNVRLAIVGGAAVVVIAALVVLLRGRGVETEIVLADDQTQGCIVQSKANRITVGRDKKITWRITNNCTNKNELVTIGNFRSPSDVDSANDNCLTGLEGTNVVWPFKEDPDDRQKRQHHVKIDLHTKHKDDLPPQELTYRYDVCTGGEAADKKSDPELVIEPS